MMNTFNTKFFFVEVWFTDQVSKAIKIEKNEIFNRAKIKKIRKRIEHFVIY